MFKFNKIQNNLEIIERQIIYVERQILNLEDLFFSLRSDLEIKKPVKECKPKKKIRKKKKREPYNNYVVDTSGSDTSD
jgi:hypothetical protein